MPRCRDCKLFDLDTVKNKRGAVLSNRVGRCLWKSTEVWPESVRNFSLNRRVEAGLMSPNDNHRCQRFIKREDA